MCVYRPQKGFPVLIDSEIEEIQQWECSQKIQTYQSVRDNFLELQKQEELARKELRRCQLETYENMQVSQDKQFV